jgi:peptidoglycan/LPS O-acetylase OafA/YrhL
VNYRADIDGLRAIAVLAVIAFHASPVRITGGFVGVDVFFVISGFLISLGLISDLDEGRFNIGDFYRRRVKRIFPALVVVLLACFLFGWVALLPEEYAQLGKHIAGGAGFVSNLMFWNESGYFDNAAITKPLLHLWSLGIEEQFYIVWPVALWLAWKIRSFFLVLIIASAAVSFAFNIWEVRWDQVAAFYSPFARFWELSLGSTLAYLSFSQPEAFASIEKSRGAIWLALAGVGVLLFSAFFISADLAFPGWWAVLPTLGTGMIILAGANAPINKTVLSSKVLVGIGLISYPLYLWHWPMLSFARIIEGEETGRTIRFSSIFAAGVLAWLTYRYVEKPIRHGKIETRPFLLGGAMLAVGVLGYSSFTNGGYPTRSTMFQETVKNPGDLGHKEFWSYLNRNFYPCPSIIDGSNTVQWDPSMRCHQSKERGPITLAIIGDSHAENLFLGLAEQLPHLNVTYYTKGAFPFLGDPDFSAMFGHAISDTDIKAIILSAYWHLRVEQNVSAGYSPKDELERVLRALIAAGKQVYVAEDIPDFLFDPKKCKFERHLLNESKCTEPRTRFDSQNQTFLSMLSELKARNPSLVTFKTGEFLCDSHDCRMAINGSLMYRDSNHLGIDGSKLIARELVANNPWLRDLNHSGQYR